MTEPLFIQKYNNVLWYDGRNGDSNECGAIPSGACIIREDGAGGLYTSLVTEGRSLFGIDDRPDLLNSFRIICQRLGQKDRRQRRIVTRAARQVLNGSKRNGRRARVAATF